MSESSNDHNTPPGQDSPAWKIHRVAYGPRYRGDKGVLNLCVDIPEEAVQVFLEYVEWVLRNMQAGLHAFSRPKEDDGV
jgi:hypothetical protein